jgi:hypothetical protein
VWRSNRKREVDDGVVLAWQTHLKLNQPRVQQALDVLIRLDNQACKQPVGAE